MSREKLVAAFAGNRTETARRLRREATPAERHLWQALRQIQCPSGHFRRQAPIGPYYADFVHHGERIIIELDGGHHSEVGQERRDARRSAYFARSGYRILRFWNPEVHTNLDGVVETIFAALWDGKTPTA